MFQYQFNKLKHLLSGIISNHVSPETFQWLQENTAPGMPPSRFSAAFVSVPRKTGRKMVQVGEQDAIAIDEVRPGFSIDNWSIDRITRVWLLLHLDPSNEDVYFKTIESLFLAAEVNELVALYSALPLLAYPAKWKARCAEGIRNNIADVLTAIMCNNPYPAENLDEPAWNQLVLKAFFTEKPVEEVIGIDLRSNQNLADTLLDYAHERWAAHRTVNPQLWRCVSPFINDKFIPDLKRLFSSFNPLEQEAAALAAYWSPSAEAKQLIPEHHLALIESGELTWDSLAFKMKNYVLQ